MSITLDNLTNELQKEINKLLPLSKAKYNEYIKLLDKYKDKIESDFTIYSLKYALYQGCHNQGFDNFNSIIYKGYISIYNNSNISKNDKKIYKDIILKWQYMNRKHTINPN